MRKTTDVTYNVSGQTVEYRVPQGRPTSATFKVLNDYAGDDDTPEFSGTATVENVTQTLSGASGPAQTDPQRVNVTSTNILTSRKYLLSESSKQEWFSPVEVGTGFVRARGELKNNYTTAATLVGTTITATIDNIWVADEGNISEHSDPAPSYRVRWEILLGGATYVAYSFFDLIRAPITCEVDIEDINARAPGLMRGLPTEYRVEQGRPLVDAALRSVRADLAAMRLDIDAFRDDEQLDELVILKSLVIVAEGGWWRPTGYQSAAEYVADRTSRYDRFIEQHLKVSVTVPLAFGTEGGAVKLSSPVTPYFSK